MASRRNQLKNFYQAIQASKENSAENFCLVRDSSCWKQGSQLLLQHFHSIESLAQANPEEIASIESLGSVIAQSLQSYFETEGAKILLSELKELGVNLDYKGQVVAADAALSGLTVVLTGKLDVLLARKPKVSSKILVPR